MSSTTPPSPYIVVPYNSVYYSAILNYITQAQGDLRYLKLTGGILIGNLYLPSLTSSGVISIADGTDALPSLAFANSLTTGLYRTAADSIGISTAGVLNSTFNSTGLTLANSLVLKAGAVGAPSLYMSTDTTTGIYRPGANQIGFSISGVQVGVINNLIWSFVNRLSAQNGTAAAPSLYFNGSTTGFYSSTTNVLGITVSGASLLTFQANLLNLASTTLINAGAGTVSLPSIYMNGDTTTGIYRPAANQLAITVNGIAQLKASSVGITLGEGTTNTALYLPDGTTAAPPIRFSTNATNCGWFPYNSGAAWGYVSSNLTSLSLDGIGLNMRNSKVINCSAGTSLLPAVYFNAQTTSGLFSSTANQIGVTCSASTVATFSSNLLTMGSSAKTSLSAGTVSAPSAYFSTNTTSGLYSSTANEIGVAISGVNVVTATANTLTMNNAVASQLLTSRGSVTQTTSINTAVTSNTQSTKITTFAAISATGVAGYVLWFYLNNSLIVADSIIVASVALGHEVALCWPIINTVIDSANARVLICITNIGTASSGAYVCEANVMIM